MSKLYCLLALCLLFPAAALASLSAEVDKHVLSEGQSVTLTVKQIGKGGTPETSSLRSDFEVRSTIHIQNTQIINGKREQSRQWKYTLIPRKTGTLYIPPITDGTSTTDAIELHVSEASNAAGNATGNAAGNATSVFLQTHVDRDTAYVQSQITLRVRLFFLQHLFQASLLIDDSSDFLHQRIGEDRQSQEQYQGRTYNVIERRYALIPQKSGHLTLPQVVFNAKVRAENSNNSFILPEVQPIRLRSKALEVDVKPIPKQLSGHWWLPARSVQITEQYNTYGPIEAGTPIERTITISAIGVLDSQLPKLTPPKIDNLQIYPDQPKLSQDSDASQLISTRTESWTIIPSKAGHYTLPAIEVIWWDTEEDREKVAQLPAKTLQIVPNPNAPSTGSSNSAQQGNPGQAADSNSDLAADTLSPVPETYSFLINLAVLLVLICIAYCVFLLYRLKRRQRAKSAQTDRQDHRPKQTAAFKALRAACASKRAQAIQQALLVWAATVWVDQPARSLLELAKRVDDAQIKAQLTQLDAMLYKDCNDPLIDELQNLPQQLAAAVKKQRQAQVKHDSALPDF